MKRPVVYILKSQGTNRYYIGSTSNLAERLKQHKRGHTSTTKRMGDMDLVFSQEFETLTQAKNAESKLKSWKRRDFIEKIIRDGKIKSADKE